MYKQDLPLNKQKWLICHETKPNHITLVISEGVLVA